MERGRRNKTSAGILLYRRTHRAHGAHGAPGEHGEHGAHVAIEVLLVHPGGPFWANKDAGAWSIPKGEFEEDEPPLDAACREFQEETGATVSGPFLALKPLRQRSGKVVHAWAAEGDFDPARLTSTTFEVEWPPRSGRTRTFPEVDRAAWFPPDEARRRILPGQAAFVTELLGIVAGA